MLSRSADSRPLFLVSDLSAMKQGGPPGRGRPQQWAARIYCDMNRILPNVSSVSVEMAMEVFFPLICEHGK